ncbi:MAG: hypothetical protein Ct9H300mP1_02500 [Planctomycetaceae bacterium]|nr:MAG: hypothetical protein Ct9H300mP1_02500 [Planctomycetaceae bacterium]
MVSLDRATGKQVWGNTWAGSHQLLVSHARVVAGRQQILISGCDRVAAFNPETGKGLWEVWAHHDGTSGTMVWHKDLVFASGGFPKAETVCIKAEGFGEGCLEKTPRSAKTVDVCPGGMSTR